ncbi:TPA: hypothetical protein G8N70_003079 [Salmonella enterica]|uniref:Pilus assembly protein PilL n=1 Tax=Salmonella enterica TaxID=28901 RepID=A0A744HEJ5_SALER|nr:hypothetical protein [Salmonella enterica]HAF4919934.1 hypothetical protein [Salmonella enterica]
MQPKRNITRLTFLTMIMLSMLTACAMSDKKDSPAVSATIATDSETNPAEYLVPVVRYGRYTLAELRPDVAQRDLSQQVVEVTMPVQLSATVGDGIRYLLQRTGFSLCHSDEVAALYALPLPAAHLHLGPETLRDALQTMAGPAWQLTLDEAMRQVCFVRLPEVTSSANAGVAP